MENADQTTPINSQSNSRPSSSEISSSQTISKGIEDVQSSDPSQILDNRWDEIVSLLRQHKGKRFNLGALLRSCTEKELDKKVITLKYSHSSHQQRMEEELNYPQSRRALQGVLDKVLGTEYEIKASLMDKLPSRTNSSPSQSSHLVRAAQALGATVVDQKEEDNNDE